MQEIKRIKWMPVFKEAMSQYSSDGVAELAAAMAYWIIFSLFPFFIFLAALVGIIGQIVGSQDLLKNIMDNLYSALDPQTAESLRAPLNEVLKPTGAALSVGALIGAVLALNSASSGVATTIVAFNRAYGVEETRNFIVKKLLALGLTLVMVLLLIGGSLLLSLGGAIINRLPLGPLGSFALNLARYVGAFLGIILALSILYWKGPNTKQRFSWFSPGAVIATLALVIFSLLFSLYISLLGGASFNKTYGTIAGVIIFLFFLRMASTIVLLGAEINAAIARQRLADEGRTIDERGQQVRVAQQMQADRRATEERLRILRERPRDVAVAQARYAESQVTPLERERRQQATLTAFGASVVTVIAGLFVSLWRRITAG